MGIGKAASHLSGGNSSAVTSGNGQQIMNDASKGISKGDKGSKATSRDSSERHLQPQDRMTTRFMKKREKKSILKKDMRPSQEDDDDDDLVESDDDD